MKILKRIKLGICQKKLPIFWKSVDREARIKSLGEEMESLNSMIEKENRLDCILSFSDFKQMYRIAKKQQELLNKK